MLEKAKSQDRKGTLIFRRSRGGAIVCEASSGMGGERSEASWSKEQ